MTEVSPGVAHACAVTAAGRAYCWGANNIGQLGTGSAAGPELCAGKWPCSTRPAPLGKEQRFTNVSAGSDYACGVTSAGAAYCWGDNRLGQLGSGDTISSAAPVAVAGAFTLAVVRAGVRHTCALTTSGAAYCWGLNGRRELGSGSTDFQVNSPIPVAGGLRFTSITLGLDSTCGLTADGTAYCWGNNGYGKLGTGDSTNRSFPFPVVGGLHFKALSTGDFHTCGVTLDGTAYCWGSNFAGELGTGGGFSTTPVAVAGGLTFATISAGSAHTCGVTSGGAAYCWGWNSYGQVGNGGIGYSTPAPMAVLAGLTFRAVGAGDYLTCGVTTDSAAYCWGDNSNGQLGDGTTEFHSSPVRVAGP